MEINKHGTLCYQNQVQKPYHHSNTAKIADKIQCPFSFTPNELG